MTDELVKVTMDNKVSGRELYDFLEVESNYTTWFNRMCEYGFTNPDDFIPKMEESTGGRPLVDHMLTLGMAKELCMIQRTPKGKQARQYFIECERRLMQVPRDSYMIADPYQRALAWAQEEKVRQTQALQLEQSKPKVDFYDSVADSKDALSMAEVAKVLGGIGRNKLFKFLRDHKVLQANNLPYQRYVDSGYLRVLEQKFGEPAHITTKTLVYQRGVEYIGKLMKAEDA